MKELLLTALKTKKLGRVCKAGAWTVLGLGILQVALNIFNAWHTYSMELAQQRLNATQFSQTINPFDPTYSLIFNSLITACAGAIFPIFVFVMLYVAGTIFTALAASTKPTLDDTDDIVYEALKVPARTRE